MLSRRGFLKVFGATMGASLLPSAASALAHAKAQPSLTSSGILVDLTKCIGCGWCQEACKVSNGLSAKLPLATDTGQSPLALSDQVWTLVEPRQVTDDGGTRWVSVKRQCMHCLDPACVSACPVEALSKSQQGPVTYDPSRCIGCRYCMVACPFGIPKFEWDQPLPRIRKCTFCADRQTAGGLPACAETCPTGALLYGKRTDLVIEAEARIKSHPEQYVNHVYGKEEFGGTSWMYISPVPFDKLGFPALKREPATDLSETVALYGTPGLSLSLALLLGGVYFWFSRTDRADLAAEPIHQEEGGRES